MQPGHSLPRLLLAGLLALALCPGARVHQGESAPTAQAAPAENFDELLRRQPYFKKILWTTNTTFAPYEILVQKQAVPEPGFEHTVVQFYGPWLSALAKSFEDKLARPAMLPPVLNPRPLRLIVLATEGDFINFRKSLDAWDGVDPSSCYDERVRSVVTYWEMVGTPQVRRYAALRSFVFGLLQQRTTAFESRQPPLWLREGLSIQLAWPIGDDPSKAFDRASVDTTNNLLKVVQLSQDPKLQNLFLLPLETLVAVTSFADLHRKSQQSAKDSGAVFDNNGAWNSASGSSIPQGLRLLTNFEWVFIPSM
jgi:hypothetical protein